MKIALLCAMSQEDHLKRYKQCWKLRILDRQITLICRCYTKLKLCKSAPGRFMFLAILSKTSMDALMPRVQGGARVAQTISGSHPAIKTHIQKSPAKARLFCIWCPEAESNHRHEDFQSTALPTELSGLCVGC